MKTESFDGARERAVVTAMVTDAGALALLAPRWSGDLLPSRWGNLVGTWCVKYYRKYGEAPGRRIESIYASWARRHQDPDTSDIVSKFLGALSAEYGEGGNSAFTVDRAAELINETKLRRFKDALGGLLDSGLLDEAHDLVRTYSKVEIGRGAGIDLLSGDLIESAFADSGETLVKYDGAAGEFFGNVFARDSLVSYLAAEGTGKSFMLMDLAFRAMLQRRRVLYFECGDNTQGQVGRRVLARAAAAPWHARRVRLPTGISVRENDPVVSFEEKNFPNGLDRAAAEEALRKITQHKMKTNDSYCKLYCHPTATLTIDAVNGTADELERQGFVPDLIVIDYADIMAHPGGKMDRIHQIELLWQQLHALCMVRHCCVATATQATREAYTNVLLGRQHVSGNKLKTANVNAFVALARAEEDVKAQALRLNFVKDRSNEFLPSTVLHIAGCLAIANPCMVSTYGKR